MDAGSIEFQQLDLLRARSGAEDNTQRRSFLPFPLILRQPAEIELHLALVLGFEASLLEFNRDQAPELAVIEEQIDEEVFAAELDRLLPGDEGEARSQFEKEEF
jgi:hypothetical protein